MKRLILALCFVLGVASPAAAEVDFIFNIKPLSVLLSSDIDGFRVSRSGSYSYQSETVSGSASVIPSFNLGLGVGPKKFKVDFTLGSGLLHNGAFDGTFVQGDIGAHFMMGPITLGPHLGLINFSELEWSSSSSGLTFDTSKGSKAGLDFTVGKKISFNLTIDYISVDEAMVKTLDSGWSVNQSSIDFSGFAIFMGVFGRF
ncbi:MAG: hypothetical protein KKB30_02555 [Proteobacteria bacterium]|nr:hypothetical protein [Pseudomonadota bacterium]MBU1716774.1 hypothetical protein [Pseudomonadota bacterium]